MVGHRVADDRAGLCRFGTWWWDHCPDFTRHRVLRAGPDGNFEGI